MPTTLKAAGPPPTTVGTMDYAAIYDPDTDVDRHYTRATGRRIRRWFRPGDRVLEFGCATGLMTALFAERDVRIHALERSPEYVARAQARALPQTTVHEGSILEWTPPGRFEHVVATNIVGELDDPGAFLVHCREHLAPGGLLHLTANNPRSLHRLVAREMGLLDDLGAVSERGARYASSPLLSAEDIETLARAAGLICLHRSGVVVKPLTNGQLAELPDAVIDGLDALTRELPGHGALNLFIFAAEDAR
ncbi:Trans-aconitate 2-methyltransferase [Paraconexibacter sp. AEG42_29]|uniref:Trans-aconitate 2-methyltransferase n=1 Tax=Paraconexibacter sp. AEG42_29 TaxID=2997339 RepID=A0AAU7B059_9ACTN